MPVYNCNLSSGGGKTTAIKLGSGAGTYDVAAVYKGYKNLTADNFIARTSMRGGLTSGGTTFSLNNWSGDYSASGESVKVTYDATAGSVKVESARYARGRINGAYNEAGGYVQSTILDVYLIVP